MIRTILVVVCVLVAPGCTTLADVSGAKGTGHGEIGVYAENHRAVLAEVVSFIEGADLELVTVDEQKGMILAQRGINPLTYGDNVAVFVTEIAPKQTEVEALHRRAMETNVFGPRWARRVIEHLDGTFERIEGE